MHSRLSRAIILVLALGILGFAVPGLIEPATADLITGSGCVDDVTGASHPNRVPTNCTANDVTFAVVGLGVQSDGCVNGTSDTLSIRLKATVRNTTAQTRYDVGLYFATDGDPNNDGATTGTCARINIEPLGATGVQACGPGALDLDGPASGTDSNVLGIADGPYLSAETGSSNSTPDGCGDLFSQGVSGCDEDGDGNWDDTVLDFPEDITLPCSDLENDGFVNIPTCATWGNQANNVFDSTGNSTCDSAVELVPGTKSKCRCENTNSTVPMPVLSCSASCSPLVVQPGETTTCTVSYTNSASCVPDPLTAERFRCGTASFLRFKTDYDETNGAVSNLATAGSGAGGSALDDGAQLVWTPASSFGTDGIIAQSESATLTFDYTVDPGATTDLTLNFSTMGFWADDNSFAPEVAQSALTCGASISTPVTLASFVARDAGDSVELEWTTATEVGTVGFRVYEELSDGWRRTAETLIPSGSGDSTSPRSYRVTIPASKARQFFLESVSVDGTTQLHGPFALDQAEGKALGQEPIAWSEIATENQRVPKKLAVRAGGPNRTQTPEARLGVSASGIYRVSYEDLTDEGIDFAGVKASQLALLAAGTPVEIYVETAAGDRNFGAGSFIEFYGEAIDTLYTDTNVYTLRVDPSSARRVSIDRRRPSGASASAYTETIERALQREYNFASPFEDPWADTRMLTFSGARSFEFPFEVDHLVDGEQRLVVDLWGVTDLSAAPDHHVRVALNGVELDDRTFDGLSIQRVDVALPPDVLVEGTNRLTIELPGDLGVDFDLINFEGFEVSYPRAFVAGVDGLRFALAGDRFEVVGLPLGDLVAYRRQGDSLIRLVGTVVSQDAGQQTAVLNGSRDSAEYWLATTDRLLRPTVSTPRPEADITTGTADVLVITHGRFRGGLAPWVAYHEANGQVVRVVDVADVYEQFGHGVVGAQPIAEYIRFAATELSISSVVLVGGDTYDYKDYLGLGSISYIPSLYAATDDLIRFAPVDPLYTDLDGDNVPDLPIGRMPVRTEEDLEGLVERTLQYGSNGYRRTAVLAADAFDAGANVSFAGHSEELRKGLGADWTIRQAYLDSLAVADARQVVLDSLERGTALTSFVGHSGPHSWTFKGLFSTADARNLTNAGKPTVVVQWGCWNTYFVEPNVETLGSAWLLSGDRGAAAVLGSATLTDSASAQKLGKILTPLLTEPGLSLGQAVTQAKKQLAISDPDLLDVLLGWTLLGDPLLVIED